MPHSSPTRPCLLIVDDTPANIQILVGLLQADYELKVATRGAQALKICEQNPHLDLILLDVMMPETDGFAVCRALRESPATRDIPVIFLTAKAETDDVVHGFELGANDYVSKPFRPAELLARVRTHLLVRSQRREIERKNTEMKEMLQIICHDMANHFGTLSLAIELAQMQKDPAVEKLLARLAPPVRNGIGLTRLVRQMRMSEDKGVVLQPVALPAAIDECVVLNEPKLQAKSITLRREIAADLVVRAEPSALVNSVLGNILSNAIKFSHPGAVIDIDARLDNGEALLRIRDHGVGMPPAVLATLFDFTKSHSRVGTSGEKGTGFGMPLMRKFVLLFGGSVAVATRELAAHPDDHGTEFVLRLKLADAPAPAAIVS